VTGVRRRAETTGFSPWRASFFWPHINIEMTDSFDVLKSSYWGTCTVTNNGLLPLENIKIWIRPRSFSYIPKEMNFSEADKKTSQDVVDETLNENGALTEREWGTKN
jgi:hypothetical protein